MCWEITLDILLLESLGSGNDKALENHVVDSVNDVQIRLILTTAISVGELDYWDLT